MELPERSCEGYLTTVASLNAFAVLSFVMVASIRWVTKDRSYTEACLVTYVIVFVELVLKLVDATLPVVVTAHCFPQSIVPPFNTTFSAYNCAQPCMAGDLFAVYALYCLAKTGIGAADLLVSTPTLLRKPREWYRWAGLRTNDADAAKLAVVKKQQQRGRRAMFWRSRRLATEGIELRASAPRRERVRPAPA